MTQHLPVLVWQRGNLRIVAVDERDDEGEPMPMLILERRYENAMREDCWRMEVAQEDDFYSMDALCLEIASRVEVLPPWVRQLIKDELADINDADDDSAA